jgi:hypothetical protein
VNEDSDIYIVVLKNKLSIYNRNTDMLSKQGQTSFNPKRVGGGGHILPPQARLRYTQII